MISLSRQFKDFLSTSLLWDNQSTIGLKQFPEVLGFKEVEELNPEILEIPENLVLGKRVERFFEFYLKSHPDFELITQNLQIISNKITLGELDYIIRNKKNGGIYHIELAYKFYLKLKRDTTDNALDLWIGPNLKDNLSKKLYKLEHHQLPLLHQDKTKEILKTYQINPEKVKQVVLFFGHLFIPLDNANPEISNLSKSAISGFWIKRSQFNNEFQEHLFYIPSKKYWMIKPFHEVEWQDYATTLNSVDLLLAKKIAPLVWIKKENAPLQRIFIVWW